MKGYYTSNGFYGYVDGQYQYFSSQSEYYAEMEYSNGWASESNQSEAWAGDLWDSNLLYGNKMVA